MNRASSCFPVCAGACPDVHAGHDFFKGELGRGPPQAGAVPRQLPWSAEHASPLCGTSISCLHLVGSGKIVTKGEYLQGVSSPVSARTAVHLPLSARTERTTARRADRSFSYWPVWRSPMPLEAVKHVAGQTVAPKEDTPSSGCAALPRLGSMLHGAAGGITHQGVLLSAPRTACRAHHRRCSCCTQASGECKAMWCSPWAGPR